MTMTTPATPAPPAPENPAPPSAPVFLPSHPAGRRSGGRRAAIVVGSIVAALGAVLAIAGGALFAVFGSDGTLSTGRHDVSTATSALVSEAAQIDGSATGADALGTARIKVDARAAGGRPVFVGVGRAADVERYLGGAATDEVTDFDVSPFRLERDLHPGSANPPAPGTQPFWVASDSGASAAVNWKVRDGDYR